MGVEQAYFFQPITEGAIKVAPLSAQLDAAGQVFAAFKVHQGNRLLRVPELAADASLDLCASETSDGKQIYVTAINRAASQEPAVDFSFSHFRPRGGCTVTYLVPRTVDLNERDLLQRTEKLAVGEGGRRQPPHLG